MPPVPGGCSERSRPLCTLQHWGDVLWDSLLLKEAKVSPSINPSQLAEVSISSVSIPPLGTALPERTWNVLPLELTEFCQDLTSIGRL